MDSGKRPFGRGGRNDGGRKKKKKRKNKRSSRGSQDGVDGYDDGQHKEAPTPLKGATMSTGVWGWGDNAFGMLGEGCESSTRFVLSAHFFFFFCTAAVGVHVVGEPVLVKESQGEDILSVALGERHCVIASVTGLVSLGANTSSQLVPDTLPVVAGASHVIQVAAGVEHNLALWDSGSVVGWGSNGYDQLGLGERSTKGDVSVPKEIPFKIRIASVACGGNHSAAVSVDGRLFTWGDGVNGQLGHGDTRMRSEPCVIGSLWFYCVVQVSCGVDHTACVTLLHDVFCWGRNNYGQCSVKKSDGSDNAENEDDAAAESVSRVVLHPTRVGAGNLQGTMVVCGYDHTVCLSVGRTVYTWGSGRYGQLGHKKHYHRLFVPKQVPRLSDVVSVAAGRCVSAAVVQSGQVYVWGNSQADVTAVLADAACDSLASCATTNTLMAFRASHKGPASLLPKLRRRLAFDVVMQQLEMSASGSSSGALGGALNTSLSYLSLASPALVTGTQALASSLRHLFGSVDTLRYCFASDQTPGRVSLEKAASFLTRLLGCSDKLQGLVAKQLGSLVQDLQQRLIHHPLPGTEETAAIEDLCAVLLRFPPVRNQEACTPALVQIFLASQGSAVATLSDEEQLRGWIGWLQHFITEHITTHKMVKRPAKNAVSLLGFFYERCRNDAALQRKFPADLFYNELVSRRLDVESDFERWRDGMGAFCFCNHAWILNPCAKAEVLKMEAMQQMEHAQFPDGGENFVDILRGYIRSPFLEIVVRREHLREDSLARIEQVEERNPKDFRKQLKVTFENEQGIDEGGVRKEWFMLLVRELFRGDIGVVTWDPDTRLCWFNAHSLEELRDIKLMGVVVGLAIYNAIILELNFPRLIYKYLLNRDYEPTLEDLHDAFPALAQGLQHLLDYPGDDVEDVFCLNFQVTTEFVGEKVVHDLDADGSNKPVTAQNRVEYVEKYTRWILRGSVAQQLEHFVEGFQLVAQVDVDAFMANLEASELEMIVCGDPTWNLAELQHVAKYEGGYDATTPLIIAFWELVATLPREDQHKLLAFATGSDRIPIGGVSKMDFVIQRAGDDSEQLPTSHTCFNVLLLPEYSSKEKLEAKLKVAINNNAGFGLR